MSDDFKWEKHCSEAVRKDNRVIVIVIIIIITDLYSTFRSEDTEALESTSFKHILGLIKRNFTDRSQSTLIPLYRSIVRPHSEYCYSVWNPHFRKDIELIEGVQRRATKVVKDVEHLGLMCLHTRRITV